MTTASETSLCPYCGYENQQLDIICDHCQRVLIDYHRNDLIWFLVATLGSVVLFRHTDSAWPLYLGLSSGIIHLYGVVFSRGRAVRAAVVATAMISVGWAAWVAVEEVVRANPDRGTGLVHFAYNADKWFSGKVVWVAVVLWVASTLWALLLSARKVPGQFQLPSGYFLGLGSFVLGLWAVGSIALKQPNFDFSLLFSWLVGLALFGPFVVLVSLLGRRLASERVARQNRIDSGEESDRPADAQRKAHVFGLWFLLVSAYLVTSQYLVDMSEYVMGSFLPRLVGAPTPNVELPAFVRIMRWRVPVTIGFASIAMLAVISSAAVSAKKAFVAETPPVYTRRIAELNQDRSTARGLGLLAVIVAGTTLQALLVISNSISLMVRILGAAAGALAQVARDSFRYALDLLRYLVVPIVAFSIIAVALIVTLDELSQHERGLTTAIAPLWGAGATVFLLILALCWIAFGMAPASASKFMFAGREAALFVAPIVVGLTIAATATLPLISFALERVDIDFPPLKSGSLFYWVFLPMLGGTGVVVGFELWTKWVRSRPIATNHKDANETPDPTTRWEDVNFVVRAGVPCIAAAVGLYLGAPQIWETVLTAARGH